MLIEVTILVYLGRRKEYLIHIHECKKNKKRHLLNTAYQWLNIVLGRLKQHLCREARGIHEEAVSAKKTSESHGMCHCEGKFWGD